MSFADEVLSSDGVQSDSTPRSGFRSLTSVRTFRSDATKAAMSDIARDHCLSLDTSSLQALPMAASLPHPGSTTRSSVEYLPVLPEMDEMDVLTRQAQSVTAATSASYEAAKAALQKRLTLLRGEEAEGCFVTAAATGSSSLAQVLAPN